MERTENHLKNNNMKPQKKHIIVKAFLTQKESHIVNCADGTSIELYLGRKYGENSREINPVVCEVTHKADDVEQVDIGDLLIVHHNTLTNEASVIKKDYSEQSVIMPILADNMLYAKINRVTGELTPLYGNFIAERIDVVKKSVIIYDEGKKEEKKAHYLKKKPRCNVHLRSTWCAEAHGALLRGGREARERGRQV